MECHNAKRSREARRNQRLVPNRQVMLVVGSFEKPRLQATFDSVREQVAVSQTSKFTRQTRVTSRVLTLSDQLEHHRLSQKALQIVKSCQY